MYPDGVKLPREVLADRSLWTALLSGYANMSP